MTTKSAKAASLHRSLNSASAATYSASIRALPRSQSPNLFVLGNAQSFLAQKPFTV
jgi:hypothetical protein